MSIRIATNMTALTALGALDRNQQRLGDAALTLASGLRITRAADDAAGLSISQDLTTRINGLVQALANAHDAAAVTLIADGALATVHDTLQRMRVLVLGAGAGGAGSLDAIAHEIGALTELLNAIADFTAASGHTLLDGSYHAAFQVGPDGGNQLVLDLSQADMHASNLGGDASAGGNDLTALNILGLDKSGGIYSVEGRSADLATLSESIVAVSATRSGLGGVANQLAYTVADLHAGLAAVSASRSAVTDADMAGAAQRFATAKITTFAAASVVAQANSAPEAVLRLLDDSVVGEDRHTGRGSSPGSASSSGAASSSGSDAGPGARIRADARSASASGHGSDLAGRPAAAREVTGHHPGDTAPDDISRGVDPASGMTASAA